MRVRLVGVVLVSWLVAGVSAEQARPIFTGVWKFVGEKSTPGDRSALGDEIRLTQEANALVLEGPLTELVTQPGGKSELVVRGFGPPMVYKTDGEEHTPERNPIRPTGGGFTFHYLSGGPYRGSWDGGALVIAGSDQIPYMSFSGGTTIRMVQRALRTVFSLTADGSLLVERTMEQQPINVGAAVTKVSLRSVYLKAS